MHLVNAKDQVHRLKAKTPERQRVQRLNILFDGALTKYFQLNTITMSATISVLFFARKSKANARGEAPIYMRITING